MEYFRFQFYLRDVLCLLSNWKRLHSLDLAIVKIAQCVCFQNGVHDVSKFRVLTIHVNQLKTCPYRVRLKYTNRPNKVRLILT